MRHSKYIRVPIDPKSIKVKTFTGLTKRQNYTFLAAILPSVIIFFPLKSIFGIYGGIVGIFLIAIPIMFIGLYEQNGIYFSDKLKILLNFYKKPRKRFFMARNLFEILKLFSEKRKLLIILKRGYKNVKNKAN